MSASLTGIANLAIGHCGVGVQVTNIETENSVEARVCKLFLPKAIEGTLRAFNWPFATVYETLQLVSNNPTTEWAFAYQYPNDIVKVRRILSGIRQDSMNSRVRFQIVQSSSAGDAAQLIYSNFPNATVECTGKVKNIAMVPDDFEMGVSYLLGAYIAAQVTRGDPFKKGDACKSMFMQVIYNAIATGMNEQWLGKGQDTESILARNQGIGVPWRGWPWEW